MERDTLLWMIIHHCDMVVDATSDNVEDIKQLMRIIKENQIVQDRKFP